MNEWIAIDHDEFVVEDVVAGGGVDDWVDNWVDDVGRVVLLYCKLDVSLPSSLEGIIGINDTPGNKWASEVSLS